MLGLLGCRRLARRALHEAAAPLKAHCFMAAGTDPYANLALEDWILRNSDPQSYVLYLWRNRPTIVVGRNQNPWKECDLGLMGGRGVALARRTSGGGAVYHDLGNSNYTVVMPRDAFTRDACAAMVARALQGEGIPASVTARHDVAVDGLKVSGSAFKLTKQRAFHHGTMLIDADLARLHGCLRSPARDAIEAKGVPSVPSRVVNLRDYSLGLDHQGFCDAVAREFAATFAPPADITVVDAEHDARFDAERQRLQTWAWLYGQTPEFSHRFHRCFAWATVFADVTARHGLITHASIDTSPSALQPPPAARRLFAAAAACLVGARYHPPDISDRLRSVRSSSPHAAELCGWLLANLSFAAES